CARREWPPALRRVGAGDRAARAPRSAPDLRRGGLGRVGAGRREPKRVPGPPADGAEPDRHRRPAREPPGVSAPLRAAGLLALLAAVACSGGDGTPAPPPAPPVDAPTAAAPDAPRPPDPPDTASPPDTARPPATAQVDDRWTAGVTRRERQLSGVAVLTAFRLARNDTFDRAVFEFEDDLPSYHIEYVDRPIFHCGSGDVVELAGDGW